jgi:type IV pilus assembly protein PilY1
MRNLMSAYWRGLWVIGIGGATLLALGLSVCRATTVVDNFTGASASIPWVSEGDACLTAGNNTGTVPACSSVARVAGLPGTNQAVGNGALLLTPAVNGRSGAIISPTPFNASNGISVTFNTYTFGGGGFSGGRGDFPLNRTFEHEFGISPPTIRLNNRLVADNGADGIGFYLINAAPPVETTPGVLSSKFTIGSWGGSLGYQCSNSNTPYTGMLGGYMGLGIDEFGNFVNPNDNTNSGPGFAPNSIAIRGYGSVNPAEMALVSGASAANFGPTIVQAACRAGGRFKFHGSTYHLPDYQYLQGSFAQLPANQLIANTNVHLRRAATPISYKLTITPGPSSLLSLSYSYNNGAYQQIINNQSITAGNGPLPRSLLFGFGASTGGARNYHEITCFDAAPANQSNSASSVNVQQTGEIQTSTQVYLAYYSPDNWWGRLTAQMLQVSSTGQVTVNPVAQWDASCVLTGGPCATTNNTANTPPEAWQTIPMLTWSGAGPIPFHWTNLTSTEQGWLNGNGASNPAYGFGQDLLHYLRGDTAYDSTSFVASTTTPSFRTRTSILGDIMDSSPVWVGAPDETLPSAAPSLFPQAPFTNALYPTMTYSEDASGAETYSSYVSAYGSRNNIVYVGANDGMLHAFQSGYYTGTTFQSSTNNGQEVLSYVPYAVLQDFNTQVNTNKDYAYPGYGHNFYLDATPGTGDLFYNNGWHTWLASGMGTGGRGLFILDITQPNNFATATPASLVMGDYTFANYPYASTGPTSPPGFVGSNVTGTDSYAATVGDITGTPIIRLMNDGDYAIITGNGFGSTDGEAGIYIMLVSPVTGTIVKTLFLGTGVGTPSNPDGIAYVSSSAMNGDHFVDYIYAGDEQGNVWRFDVTGNTSSSWYVSTFGAGVPTPLFKTQNGQPITTQVLVDSNIMPDGMPQIMLQFGTGKLTPISNSSAPVYASAPQSIYGVWDWNMSRWNSLPGATTYTALPETSVASPLTIANLAQQTVTATGTTTNTTTPVQAEVLSTNPVCWDGSSNIAGCSTYNELGWYLNLSSYTPTHATTPLYEQVIYSPTFSEGAAVFNTAIPPYVNAQVCATGLQTGYTMAFDPLTGGPVPNGYFRSFSNNSAITIGSTPVSALQLNATGTPSAVQANGQPVLVQQTVSGNPVVTDVFPAGGMGTQVNWMEVR